MQAARGLRVVCEHLQRDCPRSRRSDAAGAAQTCGARERGALRREAARAAARLLAGAAAWLSEEARRARGSGRVARLALLYSHALHLSAHLRSVVRVRRLSHLPRPLRMCTGIHLCCPLHWAHAACRPYSAALCAACRPGTRARARCTRTWTAQTLTWTLCLVSRWTLPMAGHSRRTHAGRQLTRRRTFCERCHTGPVTTVRVGAAVYRLPAALALPGRASDACGTCRSRLHRGQADCGRRADAIEDTRRWLFSPGDWVAVRALLDTHAQLEATADALAVLPASDAIVALRREAGTLDQWLAVSNGVRARNATAGHL